MFDVAAYLEHQEARKKGKLAEYEGSSNTPIGYGSRPSLALARPGNYDDGRLNFLSRSPLPVVGMPANNPYAPNMYRRRA
ncbi:MAG: hypothetical protein HY516_00945 [Candidatus Aenigmarchaeota archaeon]|nr:hypothetical protein [Candidatus Aenigmarchaeota archaeon]